jgi:hypothetical protein
MGHEIRERHFFPPFTRAPSIVNAGGQTRFWICAIGIFFMAYVYLLIPKILKRHPSAARGFNLF